MREIVLDTETTGLDPGQGHRLVELGCIELRQPHPDRRDLPRLSQSRARRAGGGRRHPRADRPNSSRTSRCSPTSPTISSPSSATSAAGDPQCLLRSRLPVRRAQARGARADRARAADRHADAGAAQASGGPEPARRSVRALRHRQFAPHQARRAARRRNPGRGLCRTDRRAPGAARSCRKRRARAPGGEGAVALRARPSRWRPRVSDAERAAHREFVASLGENALWRQLSARTAPDALSVCGAGVAGLRISLMRWR